MRPVPVLIPLVLAAAVALGAQSQSDEATKELAEQAITEALDNADRAIAHAGDGLTPTPGVYLVTDPDDANNAARWAPITEPAPERIVLLIHGLDEPGTIWNALAPPLAEQGHTVARFEYPNDQAIADSSALLIAELERAHALGVRHIDIVAHSMGGLVARDALTTPRGGDDPPMPEVHRLIMVGTPQTGAPLAPLRGVAEARERVVRWLNTESWDLRPMFEEEAPGAGEAGVDLEPGSDFLIALNERPDPAGTEITVIAGRIGALTKDEEQAIRKAEPVRKYLGKERTDRLLASIRDLSDGVGDGVVPLESALALDADDTVVLEGSHRGMLTPIEIEQVARGVVRDRQDTPPAIPVILDRLEQCEPDDDTTTPADTPTSTQNP